MVTISQNQIQQKLIESGSLSLAAEENVRIAKNKNRDRRRQQSQIAKTYAGYNAEEGTALLRDDAGGVAPLTSQGTLTTSAIAQGESVRSYGGSSVDWRPVFNEGDALVGDDGQPSGGEDGGDRNDGGGSPFVIPEVPAAGYCAQQNLWYRGIPGKAPAPDCPFLGGQCDTLYEVDGTGSYISSFRNPDGERSINQFTSYLLQGPITNPRITERFSSRGKRIIEWFVDGFDRRTGEPRTVKLAGITASFGQVSDGEFESLAVLREDGLPDDCGNLPGCDESPDSQPPEGSEPSQWQAICIQHPPAEFSVKTDSERSTVTYWDAQSSSAQPLGQLTFEPNRFEIDLRCKEEPAP